MPDTQNTTTGKNEEPLVGGQGFPADNRDGTPGLIGKDDFTREYETKRINRGHTEVLAGNYADLQRIGAQLAASGTVNVKDAIGIPAGVDTKSDTVLTPGQHDASKGEITVESVREGINEIPPRPTPPENKEPNSIDPGSVSPQVEGSSSSSTSPTSTPKE